MLLVQVFLRHVVFFGGRSARFIQRGMCRRYVSNFIAMHRLRPGGDDDDGIANPDDMLVDEAVYVTKDSLEEVLETRIGGKKSRNDDLELLGDSHHVNSSEAVRP